MHRPNSTCSVPNACSRPSGPRVCDSTGKPAQPVVQLDHRQGRISIGGWPSSIAKAMQPLLTVHLPRSSRSNIGYIDSNTSYTLKALPQLHCGRAHAQDGRLCYTRHSSRAKSAARTPNRVNPSLWWVPMVGVISRRVSMRRLVLGPLLAAGLLCAAASAQEADDAGARAGGPFARATEGPVLGLV